MTNLVNQEICGSVCLIELINGRDTQLSRPLCFQLNQAVDAALADADVDLILILGQGATFLTGYPLTEISSEIYQAELFQLVDTFANAAKPIVIGLNGNASGVGFELALLAAFRLAAPDVEVGITEVALGLPPCAGASQILPRLMGADAALSLLHAKKPVKASRLDAVIDAEIQGDFKAGALRFAQAMSGQNLSGFSMAERSEGMADPAAYQTGLLNARDHLDEDDPVKADIVNALESALLLPFSAGLAFERDMFVTAEMRPVSRALRHISQQRDMTHSVGSSNSDEANDTASGALLIALLNTAEQLCHSGTPIEVIDRALFEFGMAKGPFELADQIGLDRLKQINASLPSDLRRDLNLLSALCSSDEIGQESEAGYYLYDEGYRGAVNPEAVLMSEGLMEGRPKKRSPAEITEIALAALMNAGCAMLETSLVSHPGAIDLLAIDELGFAISTGGPMHAAQEQGILHLRYQLVPEKGLPDPQEMLLDMIKNGLNFSALNREFEAVS
ncbi:MAG: enoyl-CoA hydratase/isomerase family protein [Cognatishimia sp.]|uniref:enoyl-CoA hydratase-related protein n=1 Tax=Cognatishimia sp. TaxID=2211648 RepID=UPI003B8CFDE6